MLPSNLRSTEFSFELAELIPSLIWFAVPTDAVRVDLDKSVEFWDVPELAFILSFPIFSLKQLTLFDGPRFVILRFGAKISVST